MIKIWVKEVFRISQESSICVTVYMTVVHSSYLHKLSLTHPPTPILIKFLQGATKSINIRQRVQFVWHSVLLNFIYFLTDMNSRHTYGIRKRARDMNRDSPGKGVKYIP